MNSLVIILAVIAALCSAALTLQSTSTIQYLASDIVTLKTEVAALRDFERSSADRFDRIDTQLNVINRSEGR